MELSEKRPAPAVLARGFCFRYPSAAGAPDGGAFGIGPVDWEVPEGAFVLLVGATGSGKSTLLRNLVGALVPEGERSGALEVLGADSRAAKPATAAAPGSAAALGVGFVSQSPENQVVCDTVWHEMAFGLENLGVPRDVMRRRVAEAAHFFGIEPWFRRRVDSLSGGQKQVLTLASVLALRPRLLLLDEPTAMLDAIAEKSFLHELFRINRELGVTVVLATHAPQAAAEYATSAARVVGGRVEPCDLREFAPRPLDVAELRRAGTEKRRVDVRPAAADAWPGRPDTYPDQPVVSFRDAYVRYGRGEEWILRGLDLEVRAGSIHALLGGNGCGKTTLLAAVAGVRRPERGRVENRLAGSQALLPQDPKALFVCDSVAEELAEWQGACGYSDADVAAALRRFGLAGCEARHPYDLSGGQQQLLALAKLMLTGPRLLLLDEPTKGLDASAKLTVAEALLAASAAGATILMATHDLAFAAALADEATLLFDGERACTQAAGEFFDGNLFLRPLEDAFCALWREP